MLLLEFGAEGRYLCHVCLDCHWGRIHETDIAIQQRAAYVDPRLYGRTTQVRRRQTGPDYRPPSAYTWKLLRGKLRRFAVETMHMPRAKRMELEDLAPLIGMSARGVLESLGRGARTARHIDRGANAL